MVRWNKILAAALLLTALAATSCQRELVEPELRPQAAFNLFSVTDYDYSVDMQLTRSSDGLESFSLEDGGRLFTLTETPRGLRTRASYEDVDWDAHDSKVGIYLVEHLEDSQINDPSFDESIVNVVASSANLARNGNVINSSSIELLEQVKYYVPGNSFRNKTVDAYAYFPYAEEITQVVALPNTSNSLVGMFNSTDRNNVLHLPFTMKPTQTDDNIWFHDLMSSVREDVNEFNTFGNVAKKNRSIYSGNDIVGYYDLGENRHDASDNDASNSSRVGEITCDNVHMRMKHLFSRFTVSIKYDSRFEGAKINRVFVDGSKVYSFGEIDLLRGEVTPGGASRIDRLMADDVIHADIKTDMMLCPCELDGEDQMVFHIIIDGTEYKCDLYKMMGARSIKSSYIYDLNFSFPPYSTLTVTNGYGSTVACVQYNPGEYANYGTYGERAIFPQNTSGKPLDQVGDILQWMVVAPREGWKFEGIYVNGKRVPFNEGSQANDGSLEHVMDGYRIRDNITSGGGDEQKHYYCRLEEVNDKNTRYDVVCVPTSRWYAQPEHIIQQFDGIYNNGFGSVDVVHEGITVEAEPPTDHTVTIWKDLSGRNNDARLQNVSSWTSLQPWRRSLYDQKSLGVSIPYTQYETTMQSGWVEGGLKLDGVNDYVTFPAVLPDRVEDANGVGQGGMQMTMEMYVCMERAQPGRFPRIICEAEPGLMASDTGIETRTTHGYPSFVFTSPEVNAAGPPTVSNVFHYPVGACQLYFMGCGHNDGYSGSSLQAKPDGDRTFHIVLWYSGGYGKLTDMSIFKSGSHQSNKLPAGTDLGGGDPRNCLVAMVEYWDTESNEMARKTLSFRGDGDSGVASYRDLLDAVFGAGVVLDGANDYVRVLTKALNKNIAGQGHAAWLEDPFVPTERWACIGGRLNDYSRQFNGTIFSFIMYDTLLPIADIDYNRNLHFSRFGATKRDVRGGGDNN